MKLPLCLPDRLLLIPFLFVTTSSFAQLAPATEWDKSFGNIRSDDLYKVIQTSDGGYLLAGDSDSPAGGDKSQGTRGFTDYWILKTDALGNKQWDRRFGGNLQEEMYGVIETADGYLLGGWSKSDISGDQTQAKRGGSDFWIVKTDKNGNKLWDQRYGGTDDDELRAMAATSDGGFVLAGESKSGIGGEKTQANHGVYDLWMVKTDANGNLQWDASFGGSDDDRLNAIQQTPDGGYILGAWTISPQGFDVSQEGKGATDMWLVKVDSNGSKLWDARFGGDDNEYLYALDQTSDNGFILAGYTRSGVNGDVTVAGKGDYDFWVVKTNSNGVKQWDNRYGGLLDEKGKSIYETNDHGFLIGGWSESDISGDKTQDAKGLTDYWLLKTDSAGNKQWDLDFGGNNDERLHDVPQTTDGGFMVGGHSSSGMNGDKSQPNHGLSDYWIIKLSAEVPANVYYADADADGYGNPSKDTIALSQPAGYVTDGTDCNDQEAAIHPGATDLCNQLDDNCDGVIDENSIAAALTPTGIVQVCKGTPLTMVANTGSGITYIWIKDGQVINNANGNQYTTNKKGTYTVAESNVFNCFSTSPSTVLQTLSKPPATVTPLGDLDICLTGSVTLQANGGNNLSYLWKKNGNNIPGATAQSYIALQAGVYKVVVTKANGCKKISPGVMVVKTCKQSGNEKPKTDLSFSVYPNPSSGRFIIMLPPECFAMQQHNGAMSAALSVCNSLGETVFFQPLHLNGEQLNETIQLDATIPDGIYVLRILADQANQPAQQVQWLGRLVIQRSQ